ncbi:MAG: membrane integrity-associated transporter subunit PqiC [Variovorax sp.]|nr:MAG: membrane integrity-associated transporter subunit PqiC [Variovorax sp.]
MTLAASRRTVACAFALLALGGCAGTAPQYYSLADAAAVTAPAATSGAAAFYIDLAPVAMPERFARPQLVVRQKGANEGPAVDILEQHRWSSSFESELRDALASGVAMRLGAVDATRSGRPAGQPGVRIAVQLRQFDAIEGSRVDAAFSWTLRPGNDQPTRACQLTLSEPAAAPGIDALARSAQRVTSRLADAVARSIGTPPGLTSGACPA